MNVKSFSEFEIESNGKKIRFMIEAGSTFGDIFNAVILCKDKMVEEFNKNFKASEEGEKPQEGVEEAKAEDVNGEC